MCKDEERTLSHIYTGYRQADDDKDEHNRERDSPIYMCVCVNEWETSNDVVRRVSEATDGVVQLLVWRRTNSQAKSAWIQLANGPANC